VWISFPGCEVNETFDADGSTCRVKGGICFFLLFYLGRRDRRGEVS
jgi:hypothetical protein